MSSVLKLSAGHFTHVLDICKVLTFEERVKLCRTNCPAFWHAGHMVVKYWTCPAVQCCCFFRKWDMICLKYFYSEIQLLSRHDGRVIVTLILMERGRA